MILTNNWLHAANWLSYIRVNIDRGKAFTIFAFESTVLNRVTAADKY